MRWTRFFVIEPAAPYGHRTLTKYASGRSELEKYVTASRSVCGVSILPL